MYTAQGVEARIYAAGQLQDVHKSVLYQSQDHGLYITPTYIPLTINAAV